MHKYLLTLIFTLASIICATGATPASVTRVVKQVNDAPTLHAKCTINGRAASLTTSGNCYHIDLGNAEVYFNGKTQWSYSPADKEVTILNPTADEIAESNPLAILRNLERDFNGEPLKGKPNTVRLTPKDRNNQIAEATITFDPTSGWPTHITIIAGSQRLELANLSFSTSKTKQSAGAFTFNPPKNSRITDLR